MPTVDPEKKKEQRRRWYLKNPHYSRDWKRKNPQYDKNRFDADPALRKARNAYQREYSKIDSIKKKARKQVYVEVRAGRIIKQSCEECRIKKTEAHHDDYSKPLEVRWLCKRHHVAAHKK
jgi:hypothetical protein